MPLPRISSQPEPLHIAQPPSPDLDPESGFGETGPPSGDGDPESSFGATRPVPPHDPQLMSHSALGSVYGKKLGRKRTWRSSPKSSRTNANSVPFRSASETSSPTTNPSTCVNIGVWVRSN